MLAVTVEAAALKKTVSAIKSLGLSRSTIPVLQCVKLEAKNATLEVMATNLESNIRIAMPANGEGAWCLNFAKLQAVLSSIPDGALIGVTGDNIATIAAGKIKATIAALPVSDFADWSQPATENPVITISADKLIVALKAVAWATDDHRQDIKGVHFLSGTDSLRLEATNGHVVSRVRVACTASAGVNFILPQYAAAEISALSGDLEIFTDKTTTTIRAGGLTWTSKLLDATYPDIDRLIAGHSRDGTQASVFDVKSLAAAVKSASGLDISDTVRSIKLTVSVNNPSFITGFGSAGETFTIPLDCECREAFEAWMNPEYLSGILAASNSETIEIGAAPKAMIMPDTKNGFSGIIMRLRDAVAAKQAA